MMVKLGTTGAAVLGMAPTGREGTEAIALARTPKLKRFLVKPVASRRVSCERGGVG